MCAVWTTATRRTPHSQEAGERQEAYKDVNIARCCTMTCSRAILFAAVADHRGLALAAAFPVTARRPPGQGVLPGMQSSSMPASRALQPAAFGAHAVAAASPQWPEMPDRPDPCPTSGRPVPLRQARRAARPARGLRDVARRHRLDAAPGGRGAVDCPNPLVSARAARVPLSQTTPVA